MITALDHVQLAVPPGAEDACRRYYRDVLGMAEIPKPAPLAARGGVWFQAGTAQLHVGVEEGLAPPARKAHPALRVTGIRGYAERIGAAGAPVTWDASLPGVQRFYSHDPFGNTIEFVEPLPEVTPTH